MNANAVKVYRNHLIERVTPSGYYVTRNADFGILKADTMKGIERLILSCVTTKYIIVDYFDVWGNEEDGFQVNNCANVGTIRLKNDVKNYRLQLLNALKRRNLLRDSVKLLDVNFLESMGMIEIFDASNDCPLYAFREIE